MEIDGNSDKTLFSWAPKSLHIKTAAMKLKDAYSLEEKLWPTQTAYWKLRYYFANKGPPIQSYGFSSSQVQMWELDYKESWVPRNWCFWTTVSEKTLESPLDCKEIQPVHSKGDQSWICTGRTDAKAETPIFWPPEAKNWVIRKDPDAGKDRRQEEKGTTEYGVVGVWDGETDSMDMSFSKLQELVKDREAWCATSQWLAESRKWLSNWTEWQHSVLN